jgi:hypothetical protein
MARGVAYDVERTLKLSDNKRMIDIIIKSGGGIPGLSKKSKSVIKKYQAIGGKTYQEFLTRIFRFYEYPLTGSTADYREWLSKHQ